MKTYLSAAILMALTLISVSRSYGQQIPKSWDINYLIGVNLGATTAVPLPGDLKITRYNPRLNPKLGANFTYFFTGNWGVGAGLTLDWKGMKVHTRVTDVHLSIDVPNLGTLTGYVTGKNTTKVNTLYLTQPLYATYRFHNPKWQVKAGFYLAESLHRKFKGEVNDVAIVVESPVSQQRQVPYATLDYSDHARKFDAGMLLGGEFRMNKNVGFFADFTWGFTPYFSGNVPIRFTMRNIYFSLGATFRICK